GGPSLGPENPIIAVNVSLAVWAGLRAFPQAPERSWAALAEAATIGALFGTPVAAALIISEALAGQPMKGKLWDGVFAPLTAAAAGALTVTLVSRPNFDLHLPSFGHPGWTDLLAALTVASVGALLGMAAVRAFPYVHRGFARLRHPMLMLPAGGVVLAALAAVGGHLTLFKGLDEIAELAGDPDGWTAGEFAVMTVVKLAALLVAASCGFRGGRIFPAVFVGTSLGLCAHALVPGVHPAVGVSAAVLGVLLAITRQGWVSLFVAAVLVSSPGIIALLCLASLPAWLLVTGRPQMRLRPDGTAVRWPPAPPAPLPAAARHRPAPRPLPPPLHRPRLPLTPRPGGIHAAARRPPARRRASPVRQSLPGSGEPGRGHDPGAAQAPDARPAHGARDGVPAGARRADAGRQRPAEPGHLRHHLDGAGGRPPDGRVPRQEHDRQGRVPAHRRAGAALRGDARRPVERARPLGGRRLFDDRFERGVHARRDGDEAALGQTQRRPVPVPGRPAEPRDGRQRPGLLGEVLHLLGGGGPAGAHGGRPVPPGPAGRGRAVRREHHRGGRHPGVHLRRVLRTDRGPVRRAGRTPGTHRPRHPGARRRGVGRHGRALRRRGPGVGLPPPARVVHQHLRAQVRA